MNSENKNREKIKNIVIIVLIAGVIVSMIAGVYFNVLKKSADRKDGKNSGIALGEQKEYTQEFGEEINTIEINLDAADIVIQYGDVEKACVSYDMPQRVAPNVNVEDGRLTIKHEGKIAWGLNDIKDISCDAQIVIPRGTDLSELSINVDFGNLNIEGIKTDSLSIETDCGDINLDDITADKIDIDEDLGDINLDRIKCECVTIDQSAGDIQLSESSITKSDISSDLGSINMEGTFDEIKAKCSMGDIDVKSDKDENQMKLDLKVDLGAVSVNGKDYY